MNWDRNNRKNFRYTCNTRYKTSRVNFMGKFGREDGQTAKKPGGGGRISAT